MITPEQQAQITDIESYKRVTGAKRFKRTKEEKDLGLSPEEALQKRLNGRSTASSSPFSSGEIVLRIKPAKGTDPDYLSNLPKGEITASLSEKWYMWLDEKLSTPYNGNTEQLLRHILEMGLGSIISHVQFEKDVKDYEDTYSPKNQNDRSKTT